MTINEGAADRVVRLVVAAAAVLFSWWAGFGSVGGIILLVVGRDRVRDRHRWLLPAIPVVQVQHTPVAAPDDNA